MLLFTLIIIALLAFCCNCAPPLGKIKYSPTNQGLTSHGIRQVCLTYTRLETEMINLDEAVNIADVTALIDYLLSGNW